MHSLQSVQRQWEVYTWRVIENWGVNTQNILSHTLCHVATWDLTSRRQNGSSLSRRDVRISRRDVSLTTLCHVATWIFTSRRHFNISLARRDMGSHVATSKCKPSVTSRRGISRRDVIWSPSLSRRDVRCHVATSIGYALCRVATWDFTSRRGLVSPLSRRDVNTHVAT